MGSYIPPVAIHRPFGPASNGSKLASLGDKLAMHGILDSWKNMTSQDKGQTQATISVGYAQLHSTAVHEQLTCFN